MTEQELDAATRHLDRHPDEAAALLAAATPDQLRRFASSTEDILPGEELAFYAYASAETKRSLDRAVLREQIEREAILGY